MALLTSWGIFSATLPPQYIKLGVQTIPNPWCRVTIYSLKLLHITNYSILSFTEILLNKYVKMFTICLKLKISYIHIYICIQRVPIVYTPINCHFIFSFSFLWKSYKKKTPCSSVVGAFLWGEGNVADQTRPWYSQMSSFPKLTGMPQATSQICLLSFIT